VSFVFGVAKLIMILIGFVLILRVNMRRISNIDSKLQSLCAGDVELKESAKRV
jgi:hypothetical protein